MGGVVRFVSKARVDVGVWIMGSPPMAAELVAFKIRERLSLDETRNHLMPMFIGGLEVCGGEIRG